MTVTYGIIEEHYAGGGGSRVSYGIAAYADADEEGTATILGSVHDISSDRQKLLEQIQKYNQLELSLIHLQDVITDFLAG